MSRPKSSTAGVIDLVVSGYSAAKIRGMAKTQERHMSNINDAIKAQARAQEAQAKSQALMVMGLASATSEGMHALASEQELNKRSIKKLETAFTDLIAQSTAQLITIDERLEKLNQSSWEIAGYLSKRMEKEDFVGDQRYVLFTIDSILDDLEGLGLHFLPYQMYKINQLEMISSARNLAVQDFKTFSFDEMQRAKDILGRLRTANESCLSNLEKTDKAVESFVRFEELLLEITTHIASGRQKFQQNISRGKDNLKQQQARLNNEQRAIDAFTTELEQLPDSPAESLIILSLQEKLRLLSNIEHEVEDSTTEAPMDDQSRQLIEDEIKSTEKEIKKFKSALKSRRTKLESSKLRSTNSMQKLENSIKAERNSIQSHTQKFDSIEQQHGRNLEEFLKMLPESVEPGDIIKGFSDGEQ